MTNTVETFFSAKLDLGFAAFLALMEKLKEHLTEKLEILAGVDSKPFIGVVICCTYKSSSKANYGRYEGEAERFEPDDDLERLSEVLLPLTGNLLFVREKAGDPLSIYVLYLEKKQGPGNTKKYAVARIDIKEGKSTFVLGIDTALSPALKHFIVTD